MAVSRFKKGDKVINEHNAENYIPYKAVCTVLSVRKSTRGGYERYECDVEAPDGRVWKNCDEYSFKPVVALNTKPKAERIFELGRQIADRYKQGDKLDLRKARKICNQGFDLTENELMQACEVGVVLEARRIANNGQPLRQRFDALYDLYGRQVRVEPKDQLSASRQQYSTPCPLAFMLGEWVRSKGGDSFYEPTAGNGLLTIALPTKQTTVNELDDLRYNSLAQMGFHSATMLDATTIGAFGKPFSGVIMNPPFDTYHNKKDFLVRSGTIDGRAATYTFERLDHKIAILALEQMADKGRAAIIVGGKMSTKLTDWRDTYWKNGALFGQWRTFVSYLHRQYRIADIIYLDGQLYEKQGTTFPIVVLLIDGRTQWNAERSHVWHTYDERTDSRIDTYAELYRRIEQHLQPEKQEQNQVKIKVKTRDESYKLIIDGEKEIDTGEKAPDDLVRYLQKNYPQFLEYEDVKRWLQLYGYTDEYWQHRAMVGDWYTPDPDQYEIYKVLETDKRGSCRVAVYNRANREFKGYTWIWPRKNWLSIDEPNWYQPEKPKYKVGDKVICNGNEVCTIAQLDKDSVIIHHNWAGAFLTPQRVRYDEIEPASHERKLDAKSKAGWLLHYANIKMPPKYKEGDRFIFRAPYTPPKGVLIEVKSWWRAANNDATIMYEVKQKGARSEMPESALDRCERVQ